MREFVIEVKRNREEIVCDLIKRTLRLENYVYDVSVYSNGCKIPGYIFIKMNFNANVFQKITNMPFVYRFLDIAISPYLEDIVN